MCAATEKIIENLLPGGRKNEFSFRVREIAAQTPKSEQMINARKIR